MEIRIIMKNKLMKIATITSLSLVIAIGAISVGATSVTKTIGYKGKAETTMQLGTSFKTSIRATQLSGQPQILTTIGRYAYWPIGYVNSAKNTVKVTDTNTIYTSSYTANGNDIKTRGRWENQSDDTSITGVFSLFA